MAAKVAPPKDPFDAVSETFNRLAASEDPNKDKDFWKKAAEENYREAAFHSDMESKDVRVLVKALQKK